MRAQLRVQLESSGLTMGGFRLLELLHREGPMNVPVAARKRQCTSANLMFIFEPLIERGWVSHEFTKLPPVPGMGDLYPKAKRGRKREGHRVGILSLTPRGEKFIELVFPKNAKVVKGMMRSLDGREQESLSRLCRKLRQGDVRKFASEITHEDVKD
jgi:DNA-binding MarR family transcriptional regulator